MKNIVLAIFILICTFSLVTSPTVSAVSPRNSLNESEEGIDFVPGELIVTLKKSDKVVAQGKNFHDKLVQEIPAFANSIKWESSKLHASLIKVKEGDELNQMKLLKQNPDIESVELNRIHYARGHVISTDPNFISGDQWNLSLVNAPSSWQHSTGSPNVIVAVLDSGIEYTHSDLASGIWNNDDSCSGGVDNDLNLFVDDCRGWDFVNDDNNPIDDSVPKLNAPLGHGTFVSGLIGSKLNTINGASISPNVSLMPIKVLNENGGGNEIDIISGIEYAVANGANVINMSLGVQGSCNQDMQNAVQLAHDANVVFIVSARDKGQEDVDDSWPLCNHVISVTATDNFNNSASYSDWVNTNDLAAPGGELIAIGGKPGSLPISSTIIGNGFSSDGRGTSFAAPLVSGCAALIKTINPTLNPDTIQTIMETSALDLIDSGYIPNHATVGKDKVFGSGLLQCDKAILKSYEPACSPPPTGDWNIATSCTMQSNATILGDVTVQNNSILTIPAGVTLDIDFLSNHLTVTSGSGVLIKSDGKIT
jgi:subtilisin family serine protease